MKFDLLSNGADSFRNVKICMQKYERADEGFSAYYIKDAIIYLDHAIEILFKYMLSLDCEYAVYKDSEKAKEKMRELNEKLENKRNEWRIGKDPFVAQITPFNNIYDLNLKRVDKKALYTID